MPRVLSRPCRSRTMAASPRNRIGLSIGRVAVVSAWLLAGCAGSVANPATNGQASNGAGTMPNGGESALQFFQSQPRDPSIRHVHVMHVDGLHADLFRRML